MVGYGIEESGKREVFVKLFFLWMLRRSGDGGHEVR